MSAEPDESIQGGCACGGVRYRLTSKPIIVHCCHCTWCQRETGSAFAVNAVIEADRVELVRGEPQTVATPSNSGKGQQIFRCPDCRVALWSKYSGAGDAIHFLRVGTLDNPDLMPPDIHIYTSTKRDWVILPSNKPTFAEYYNPREQWPEESRERYRLAKS